MNLCIVKTTQNNLCKVKLLLPDTKFLMCNRLYTTQNGVKLRKTVRKELARDGVQQHTNNDNANRNYGIFTAKCVIFSILSDRASGYGPGTIYFYRCQVDGHRKTVSLQTTNRAEALRKAHQANDRDIMKACGYAPSMTESEIVTDLINAIRS